FQAEDGIRDKLVTGVQTCALPISERDGKKHQATGSALTDYYVFDTPVLSPCFGAVSCVVNHVPDNAPGQNNPDENWGNYVIIFRSEERRVGKECRSWWSQEK